MSGLIWTWLNRDEERETGERERVRDWRER
jgi:hypothetical protein